MKLRRALVALTLAGAATAAELPSRSDKTEHAAPKARICEIDGERGFALPNGGCMRVGGSVSVGVTTGAVRH